MYIAVSVERIRFVEHTTIVSLHRVLGAYRRGMAAPHVIAVSLSRTGARVTLNLDGGTQVVPLTRTPYHFGGTRWYFSCECETPVFKLYRPYGAERFRCRPCHRLRYQSEYLSRTARLEHRATNLLRCLGGSLLRVPTRPKGMWRTTYARRREAAELLNAVALARRLS